ncbi:hypothetical protein SAMN04488564_106408 [Lentzea waywayandensis]|uniref:Protein kinase domain-containing protein n=1 Tax=Lentzea waywayandensis TaxID=84724 RepID=A0A1I6EZ11_9PSEU|nr:hypothetical protein [Lentzea waywayandensis]SFR22904.1 hypothetical protein SAMN04488564_106408 [Lentzea waywayandensis]
MTSAVEYSDLGQLGAQLGRGGQAVVWDAPNAKVPGVSAPLVYKEYKQAPPSGAELRKIVGLRAKLSGADLDRLNELTTWPLRVVERAGVACGILMRRIPAEFGAEIPVLSTGGTKWIPREVQFLFIPPDRLGGPRIGWQVPTWEQRLGICRDFAELLDFYHERLEVVFGDINPKNELYRLDGRPSVMFIDCDGVRSMSQVARNVQLNVDDWQPPERGPLTRLSDRYKFGLFVRRTLLPDKLTSTATDPAAIASVLDRTGTDLLTRAITKTADPKQRPSAGEWLTYFRRLLGEDIDPPVLIETELDRSFVALGNPVQLRWRATDAVTLDVVVDGKKTSVDARPGSGVVQLWPDRTTHIAVTAANSLGTDSRVVGPVAVIPPPDVLRTPVVLPDLPPVTEFMGSLPRTSLPDLPDVVPRARLDPFDVAPAGRGFGWPALDVARFPFDLNELLLGGPPLDGLLANSEETT